jgi:uncharacterized integral membrane protein (TIGR00697 family)
VASATRQATAAQAGRRSPVYADTGSSRYAFLLATMCVVVILSGIGASKGVRIGPIITDGGFFLFPAAYIIGDMVTEIYGLRAARRAIIGGFAANILSAASYWVIIALPGFDDDFGRAKQQALEVALGPVWQVVLAGILGFVCGQTVNSLIMWVGKKRRLEAGLLGRLAGSTGAGEFVDTVVFCTVAAPVIGITGLGQWANYVGFGFLYKVAVQYAVMPLTAALIRRIKRAEPSYQAGLAADRSC